MNSKFFILLAVFLVSTASALTVEEISAPNASTKINSLTTDFDIIFSVSYDENNSLTSAIYYDEDTNSTEKTEIISVHSTVNGTNTYTWNTTGIRDGSYYIFIETTDGNQNSSKYSEEFLVDKNAPMDPADLNATAGDMQINLIWNASNSDDLQEYNVYRSITDGFIAGEGNLIASTTETNYTDSNISFGTTYYYKIKAIDNAGNLSNESNQANASPLDETPPKTTISGFTDEEWTNLNPLTILFECTDSGSGCNKTFYNLNQTGWNCMTGNTLNVSEEGIHSIEVYSTDNTDLNENSTTYSIKIDSINPSTPADLNATANGLTINLNWTASTDINGSGIKEYKIYRNSTEYAASTTNSYADTNTDHNTTYIYYVKAVDNAGNDSNSSNDANARAIDTTGPAVSIQGANSNWHKQTQTITLTCTALDFEKLYYKINGTEYETTTNPQSFDVSSEGENSLEFWATDTHENEGTHNTATIKIDKSAPNAPSLNSPGANSNGEVNLSWTESTDNPSSSNSGIKGYKIYRKTNSESYSSIASIDGKTNTNYTDTGRSQGTTYYYKITATDNLDQESDLSLSNERQITIPSDSENNNNNYSGDSIAPSVSWREPKEGETLKDMNITLKAYISDTSTLAFVSFTYKKSSETSFNSIDSFQQNILNGTKTVIWNTSRLENGEYDLKVLARDKPGNINSKTIKIKLERDLTALRINSDQNKDQNLSLAEKTIEKAKQSKNEAIDLMNYWKKFNLNFSSDEKIIEGNNLLKKAEQEIQENQLNECIKDAEKAKQKFDEFIQTEIKEYSIETMNSSTEINLSANLENENQKLKEQVNPIREMQLIEIIHDGETYYQQNFILKFENTADKTRKIQIIEVIPKEIIESAEMILSNYKFTIIESDPVIKWETELEAGETKEIVYSLNEKLTKEKADQILESQINFEGNPIILDQKTKIENENFIPATGFLLLEGLLPIGLGAIIIIALLAVIMFVKSNRINFDSKKEDEPAGLASAYNQNFFRKKRTLRENEKPKKTVNPLNSEEEGGRFAYREN